VERPLGGLGSHTSGKRHSLGKIRVGKSGQVPSLFCCIRPNSRGQSPTWVPGKQDGLRDNQREYLRDFSLTRGIPTELGLDIRKLLEVGGPQLRPRGVFIKWNEDEACRVLSLFMTLQHRGAAEFVPLGRHEMSSGKPCRRGNRGTGRFFRLFYRSEGGRHTGDSLRFHAFWPTGTGKAAHVGNRQLLGKEGKQQ